jgi:hypothetical protein
MNSESFYDPHMISDLRYIVNLKLLFCFKLNYHSALRPSIFLICFGALLLKPFYLGYSPVDCRKFFL